MNKNCIYIILSNENHKNTKQNDQNMNKYIYNILITLK